MDERSDDDVVNRLGRFGASVAALLAVAVGVPVAAIAVARSRFGGSSPLAGVQPPSEWNRSAFTQRLGDDTIVDLVIRVSLIAVWAAATVIVVTTTVEVVHQVRHRGLSVPSVRGLGWAQPVARFIATGLVVIIPMASPMASLAEAPAGIVSIGGASLTGASTTGVGSSPADQIDGATRDGDIVSNGAHPGSGGVTTAPSHSYTVLPGDSVYSIATAHAVAPDHVMRVADEIIDANLGRTMNDGQRFTTPAYIEAGWVLELPGSVATPATGPERSSPGGEATQRAGAAAVHVVVDGDTLWDIAATHLGDPLAWTSIWDRNAGRTMNDGRVFDDPDLIVPGWELELTATPVEPDAVVPDGVAPGDDPTVSPAPRAADADTAAPSPTDIAAETAEVPDTAPERSPTTADPSAPVADDDGETDVGTPAAGGPVANPSIAAAGPAGTSSSTTAQVPVGGAADGSVNDDPGSARSDPLRLDHAALLAAGVLAIVGVARRRRLRSAEPRHRVPEPPPEVRDVERRLRSIDPGARAERIDVACRAIAAAIAGSGHRIGCVTVDDDGELTVRTTGDVVLGGPFTGSDATWTLGADVPIELLATDARQVDMPCPALVQLGLTDDGEHLLVDLEACGQLRIDAPAALADQVVTAIAVGLASSIHAEVAHLIGAALPPDALLGHRNSHSIDSPLAATELAVRLVGTTADTDASTFELRSRRTGGEVWEPAIVLLASDDTEAFDDGAVQAPGNGVAVVAAGRTVDGEASLTLGSDGWELTAFGESIRVRPIGVDDDDLAAVMALIDDAGRALDPVDELRWADDAPHQPATGDSDHLVADAAATGGPATADLVADCPPTAAAFVDRPHEIVVGLLGAVTIRDRSGDPGTFERSKTVELIAWLATHRDRSTRSGARTALWELDVRDATFANVVSEARRGLARLVAPPDGEEWVGRTLSDALPLHDLVVTDADLVTDRLDRARIQPPGQAVETLRPAVELIRDLPFAGTNYLWPDAEGITSNLVLLAIGAATEFAGHALSLGDTDGVFWATGQGLRVLPGHEGLVGLRMQAHGRSGDLAGVRQEWASYERVVTADPWSDGEPAPELVALRRQLLATAPNS